MKIKNYVNNYMERIKTNLEIKNLYNIFNETISKQVHSFNELTDKIDKAEMIHQQFLNIEKSNNYTLISLDDFDKIIISQIKKFYFKKMSHLLLDYKELDSLGYINGLIDDMKKNKNNKYSLIIETAIYDAENIVRNHSIIYHNYRKNPIDFNNDYYYPSIIKYIVKYDKISPYAISSKFDININRVKEILKYYEKQEIVSNVNTDGSRYVLIKYPYCVYSTGLNPNLLSYFSVTYNDNINTITNNDRTNTKTQKSLIQTIDNDITGVEFENISKLILEKNGFSNIIVTSTSGDYGVDILAEKDYVKYAIQCKKYSSSVGIRAVQEVIGGKAMNNAHVAVVLTNNYFTPNAKELANKNGVLLWDKNKLLEMIKEVEK